MNLVNIETKNNISFQWFLRFKGAKPPQRKPGGQSVSPTS
jgi:hypothetical protein